MDRNDERLFVSTAVGISFQLGFSSLLLAAARQRGHDGASWLSEFEARVIEDARRMAVGGDVPEAVVAETTETIVAEFHRVFDSVRTKLLDAPAGRTASARPHRSLCG